jgi:hypothetical protein
VHSSFALRLRRESGGARAAPPDNPPRFLWSVRRSPCTLSVGGEHFCVGREAGASWFKVHRPGAPPAHVVRRRCLCSVFRALSLLGARSVFRALSPLRAWCSCAVAASCLVDQTRKQSFFRRVDDFLGGPLAASTVC